MLKEAAHETRRVERHELMQHTIGQPLFGERSGGYGSGRHQHREMLGAQPLDQRYGREHLADTCAMDPDQRTFRSRHAGLPEPFTQPFGMFLAALLAL